MPVKILLVDDDPHILETAHDILEAAGFDIQTAETGAATIEKLKKSPFNVMIVDHNLTDITGAELAVKAKRMNPKLSVIMLTGDADVELGPAKDSIQAMMMKPVNPAQLIEMIKKFS